MGLKIWGICLSIACTTWAYTLSNPNPSCETQAMADYLESVYGNKIISGQMDDSYVNRIFNVSGKEPAMIAYDLSGVTPMEGYRNRDAAKAIAWVNDKGGIAQFSWHWVRPDGQGDYYSLGFDLPGALKDTNSNNYKAIVRDLDLAATELLKLKAAKVPVLWRPLHEAEGGWFWWGAHGKDALQQLYRLMYNRFVVHHKLDNLIWVWTSYVGDPNRSNWYPGDDVVDHIVYDYPNNSIWNAFNTTFKNNGKIFGIGENGTLPNPDQFTQAPWSYFLTWAYMINPVGVDKGQNSDQWINYVYNHDRVITVDELPNYKECAIDLPKLIQDNQAKLQPVIASSFDETSHAAKFAVDGNPLTRWSSAYTENQWIQVELDSVFLIQKVVLDWEFAYAKQYHIDISIDGVLWSTIYTENNGMGSKEEINFSPQMAKYVKVVSTEKATEWGVSLYEFEVYRAIEVPVQVKHLIHANSLINLNRFNLKGQMKIP